MNFYLSLLLISSLLVFAGLFINKIQAINLSEPLLAMLLGIVVGPFGLGLLDMKMMAAPESFLQHATQLTIALALVATTLSLPLSYPQQYRREQSLILTVVMLLMWLFSAVIVYAFFQLEFSLALLIAAVITPTDPVVSSSIISGEFAEKYLSKGFRNTISFESGANDGLGYPILLFCIFLLGYDSSENLLQWFAKVILWENVVSFAIGMLSGYLLGKLLHYADHRDMMVNKTVLPFALSATFLLLSVLELIHCNSIIGIFGFGIMLNNTISKHERLQEESLQESMERLFTVPVYFLFGLYLPIQEWIQQGWLLLLGFSLAILLFRRIPAMLIIRPFFKHFHDIRDVSLLGWYGPIGVAAIFYSMHVLQVTPFQNVWTLSSFVVFMSTIVHGISSLPLARWYYHAKQTHADIQN